MPEPIIPVTLRAEREADYLRVAALLSLGYLGPVTPAQVREWRIHEPPSRLRYRLVAEDAAARVIGYAHALRDSWAVPGLFWVHVAVDPAARRQGHGARLYDAVAGFARSHGATLLRAEARDACPDGLRFATRQGFSVERHIFESTLDLTAFDETPFLAALASA